MAWKKVAEKNTIVLLTMERSLILMVRKSLFLIKNGYHALDAICVHQDNSIAAGKLDGDIVECPSHFWHYNIKTG